MSTKNGKKKIIFKKKSNKFIELSEDLEKKHNINIDFELVERIIKLNSVKKLDNFENLEFEGLNDDDLEENNEEIDIDTDELIQDSIGGKIIYFDYDKNIVYNENYEIIGNIGDDGLELIDPNFFEKDIEQEDFKKDIEPEDFKNI